MIESPLLKLIALNQQLTLQSSKRLKELPVLKSCISQKDLDLVNSQRRADETKSVLNREVDTLKRNTAMLQSEVDQKDREIRGLRKEQDLKQIELEQVLAELKQTKEMLDRSIEDRAQLEHSHEQEMSTLRLRHEQELFILKKMSSKKTAKPKT